MRFDEMMWQEFSFDGEGPHALGSWGFGPGGPSAGILNFRIYAVIGNGGLVDEFRIPFTKATNGSVLIGQAQRPAGSHVTGEFAGWKIDVLFSNDELHVQLALALDAPPEALISVMGTASVRVDPEILYDVQT